MHPFRWGSVQHILIQILTTVLLGPSLPNGYLRTTSLQKAVQSRRVRGEQAQLFCTPSRVVMQGFRSCFSCFSGTRTPFFAQTTHRVFTWTTDSASHIYQFSAGTHSHATQANRPAFNFSLRYRPSLAIETLVKAISEVEGVFSQPTPEVDTSGLKDGSLHLIVRYWTLRQPQVRRTKTKAVVAIKVACVRAEIKIPQPVPVTLYSRTLDRE